jgi:hypothetical protein
VTLDCDDIESIARRVIQLVDDSVDRFDPAGAEYQARHLIGSGAWLNP